MAVHQQRIAAAYDTDIGTFLKRGVTTTRKNTVTLLGTDPHGHIIEIVGPTCSGKSEILMHQVAHTIASPLWLGRKTQGLGRSAVFIDTDGHFFIPRLEAVLGTLWSESISAGERNTQAGAGGIAGGNTGSVMSDSAHDGQQWDSAERRESFVMDALSRLYTMRCLSCIELLCCVKSLPLLLESDRAVETIFIDSISAFYWPQNIEDESVKGSPVFRSVVIALEKLVAETRVAVLCTRAGGPVGSSGRSAGYGAGGYHFLGEQWTKFVTWRVTCSRGGASGNEFVSSGVGTGGGSSGATGAHAAPAHFTVNDGGISMSMSK